MPRRLTILCGHCVSAPSNARLPKDMKIECAKLERILGWLGRRYDLTSVGEACGRLADGSAGRAGPVALSMDDGYPTTGRNCCRARAPAWRDGLLESRPRGAARELVARSILDRVGPVEPCELGALRGPPGGHEGALRAEAGRARTS
jgi:hypothetical protein